MTKKKQFFSGSYNGTKEKIFHLKSSDNARSYIENSTLGLTYSRRTNLGVEKAGWQTHFLFRQLNAE